MPLQGLSINRIRTAAQIKPWPLCLCWIFLIGMQIIKWSTSDKIIIRALQHLTRKKKKDLLKHLNLNIPWEYVLHLSRGRQVVCKLPTWSSPPLPTSGGGEGDDGKIWLAIPMLYNQSSLQETGSGKCAKSVSSSGHFEECCSDFLGMSKGFRVGLGGGNYNPWLWRKGMVIASASETSRNHLCNNHNCFFPLSSASVHKIPY